MERRLNERYPASLSAQVTALRTQERTSFGHVCDISKSGICVNIHLQLSPGEQVRLNVEESVLYGSVSYSTPEGALFRTGVEVYRVVLGGTDLSHILQTILRQEMPMVPGVECPDFYLG